jgi:hypothetical protein
VAAWTSRSSTPASTPRRDRAPDDSSAGDPIARLAGGAMPCTGCGEMTRILTTVPNGAPWPARRGGSSMYRRCGHCGATAHSSLAGRVLDSPEGRRFHREHPRIRTLPERRVEVAGRPALLTAFESVGRSAVLETVTDLATLRTVVVRGASPRDDATRAAPSR